MNPRAMKTVTVGWARVGELSVVAAASAWKAQVTPADETPFQMLVLTVTCLAISRKGFLVPCAVRIIEGSMKIGIPKPPAEVGDSAAARSYSKKASIALRSSS